MGAPAGAPDRRPRRGEVRLLRLLAAGQADLWRIEHEVLGAGALLGRLAERRLAVENLVEAGELDLTSHEVAALRSLRHGGQNWIEGRRAAMLEVAGLVVVDEERVRSWSLRECLATLTERGRRLLDEIDRGLEVSAALVRLDDCD